jgi:hypothetical protein
MDNIKPKNITENELEIMMINIFGKDGALSVKDSKLVKKFIEFIKTDNIKESSEGRDKKD